MAKPTGPSTTQQFLEIYDVTNDLIILKDGAVALVLTVSAMNFGLLSEEEQDATIYAYAALLNSLSFPIQILVRSQPKDVTNYLKLISQQEEDTVNPVYKQRIREYRQFVESLVQEQNVLDKKFYVVIPLSAVEMGLSTQSIVPGSKAKPLTSYEKSYIIDKAKTNLSPRRDHLVDQFARIGLYSRQLVTQELIQVLFSSYNPESFEGQKVADSKDYTTPLVQPQIQGDTMSTPTPPSAAAMPGVTPAAAPASLGVTTPADMGKTATSPVAPSAAPAAATMTPIAPTTPVSVPPVPAPTSSVAENPILTIPTPAPVATPPTPLAMTSPVLPPAAPIAPVGAPASPAPAIEEQSMINQTLSQLSATPVVMPPASASPAAGVPEV